ncbi:MAG: CAP domain-containing protein [Paracoccaceae bacterium]
MHKLFGFLAALLLSVGVAQTAFAQSCAGARPSGNINRAIDSRPIDQVLFAQLVLYYTNVERCQRGMRAVQLSNGTQRAATFLAEGMAQTRTYSHTLNLPGMRTLSDRLHFAGESFRRGGENIALNFYFVLNGRSFTGGACNYRYQGSGQPVPKHSYDSLASELMAGWMASAGHRSNILGRQFNRMGAAIGLDPRGQLCGQIYASQLFTG